MSIQPGGAFAAELTGRRSRFNALFADARRVRPRLDQEAFTTHLLQTVAPIVERVAAHAPGQAGPVTEALYELSLELVGQEILGPRSRCPAIVEGWQRLLPALAPHLAEAPRHLPGALTNALHHLSVAPGARPRDWIESVQALAALAPDTPSLLEAAKVAAWRAGLAHYRLGALDVCRRLPPALAAAALGTPEATAAGLTPSGLEVALDRLRDDPWLNPAAALAGRAESPRRLQLVRRVGAFRGFGGVFMAPPTVTCPDGQFVVTDGTADPSQWLLCADRFGASLHRATAPREGNPATGEPLFKLDRRGEVTCGKHRAVFPELAGSQSSAADHATLAVTTPLSHIVFLIALVEA